MLRWMQRAAAAAFYHREAIYYTSHDPNPLHNTFANRPLSAFRSITIFLSIRTFYVHSNEVKKRPASTNLAQFGGETFIPILDTPQS